MISLRPQMIVGFCDFNLAVTYLEGYHDALCVIQPENETLGFRGFSFWIAIRYELPRNIGWSANLRKVFPDDRSLFENLPKLYQDFLREKDKVESEMKRLGL
jgi:hypothetical protein